MKSSSKSIVSSSPGRIEKFPTAPHLLSRFSRSSGGSRSRGRSRANPIFFSAFARKKNTSESVETPEPSSPKVTCLGQVRVRRSKSPKSITTTTAKGPTRVFCGWLRTALTCKCLPHRKLPSSSSSKSRRRFLLMFSMGKAHRKKVVEEKPKAGCHSELGRFKTDSVSEEKGESKIFVSSAPPKNALLLMRCRSEPRRSSTLADRYWGSPPPSPGAEDDAASKGNRRWAEDNGSALAVSTPHRKEEHQYEEENAEMVAQPGVSSRPFILTRCKSEPSTRLANLFPDDEALWKKRRLGFATQCQSPLGCVD